MTIETAVQIELVGRKTVTMTIRHEEDESPTDLTDKERARALESWHLGQEPDISIERVTE